MNVFRLGCRLRKERLVIPPVEGKKATIRILKSFPALTNGMIEGPKISDVVLDDEEVLDNDVEDVVEDEMEDKAEGEEDNKLEEDELGGPIHGTMVNPFATGSKEKNSQIDEVEDKL
jgi:hypothetical protein